MRFIQHQTDKQGYQLQMAQMKEPVPDANQVLVQVFAFGINRADVLQAEGKYPPPPEHSTILGLEIAGKIIEVGAKVKGWNIGDKVFCLTSGGGYAEYAVVDYRHLLAIPEQMTMAQAAGMAEVFLTAYQSLFELCQLQAQQKVLIHAGASGVGLAATQLAKHADCLVAVTSSSNEKLAACHANGADLLINYHKEDFVEVIRQQWTAVDAIIDVVGATYLNRNLKAISLDGTIVQLAMLGGRYAEQLDIALLLGKRVKLQGSTLRNRSDDYKAQLVQLFNHRFGDLLKRNQLLANIQQVFDSSQIEHTHQILAGNSNIGKLVVSW
ncbi:NAD(P)H-quinone oxidoreductase [Neptunicella sp. SCSIO 80796]|uniref:NAD(P)H-quinone oxidoreductase n=1 Tax=Neptunicella plasticusilytica TaxID=3117012 RepID=UPI003A4E6668